MKKIYLNFLFLSLLFCLPSKTITAQATLVSQFDFNGNLNDQLSVSTCSLFNNSSTAYVNGALSWTAIIASNGGGLLIEIPDASFTENDYSIAIDLNYNDLSGYRKIIDYNDQNNDEGLYFSDGSLDLYDGGDSFGSNVYNPNTFYTILITRTGADDSTRTYLIQNNALTFEAKIEDNSALFVPTLIGANRRIGFFHDDTSTEYPDSGYVRSIRIWNGIVTATDVCNSASNYTSTPTSLIFCNGSSRTLTFGTSPDPSFNTYTLNPTSVISVSAVISPTTSTTYSLFGDYYSTGCNTPSTSISATVNPSPTVTCVTSTSVLCTPNQATLTASGATTYTWNTTSTNTVISVSPSVTTNYTVTGTDGNGCTGFYVITQSVTTCNNIQLNSNNPNIVSIYPNPNNGKFNIQLSQISESTSVEIYNSIGQLITTKKPFETTEEVNLIDVPSGIYLIIITENSKPIFTGKIIKN